MRWMAIERPRGRPRGRIGSESREERRKGLSEGKTDKRKRRREGGARWKKKDERDEGTRWEKKRSKMEWRKDRLKEQGSGGWWWRAKHFEVDRAEVVKKTTLIGEEFDTRQMSKILCICSLALCWEREKGERRRGSNMKVQAKQTSQEWKHVQTNSMFFDWLLRGSYKENLQQRNWSRFQGLALISLSKILSSNWKTGFCQFWVFALGGCWCFCSLT